MTQDNKDIRVQKRTLGLNSNKLDLTAKVADAGTLSIKPGVYSRTTHSSNNGTVVVVTKNKSSSHTAMRNSITAQSDLSEPLTTEERNRRLKLIQLAERQRTNEQETAQNPTTTEASLNPADEKNPEQQAQLIPEVLIDADQYNDSKFSHDIIDNTKTQSIAKISAEEATNAKAESIYDNNNQSSENYYEPELRSEQIKTLALNKGKIRNLDHLYKPQPVVEDLIADSAELTTNAKTIDSNDTKEQIKPSNLVAKKKTNKNNIAEDQVNIVVNKKVDEEKKIIRKLSVNKLALIEEEDDLRKTRSLASLKRAREKAKKQHKSNTNAEKIIREVIIPDLITIQELSNRMAEKAGDLIKALMKMGVIVTVNQLIDTDTAELLVTEFGHKFKRVTDASYEKNLIDDLEDSADSLQLRAPVVTIMGHVDHGKTSLLDALRSTDVVAAESGGITQHIGAYQVTLNSGKFITFIDTPGHEAFTAMRMRGAKVTDIVVLVVAADDGIKEQTIEAINHAKAAKVPIIVAINKIDKPNANPSAVKIALLSHELISEEMGGNTMMVEVSAKQKLGLDKLEETILLQAEFLSLKANPNRLAKGAVIEARIDKGRGAIATLLIQNGTLRISDIIVAGSCYGKVRAIINDKGDNITQSIPGTPVEILGLSQAPLAGDEFIVVSDEQKAKELVTFRTQKDKEKKISSVNKVSLEQLFINAIQHSGSRELAVIIKADVNGSAEAIANSLAKIVSNEIKVKILHTAVGGITESDVTLAAASGAIILGFNVRAASAAKETASQLNVEIKYYSIIYNLVDDIKSILTGMLSPITKEKFLGYAEVKQVFNLTKFGKVAGCYVTEGIVQRNASVRLLRDNIVIHEGKLKALRRFKDDVKEVKSGFECGISLEKYEDLKAGDKIEVFSVIEEARTL